MGIHVTKYKTENGKTRKVKDPAAKPAGADSKNGKPETPAKQGA